jgi:hypothetical protein
LPFDVPHLHMALMATWEITTTCRERFAASLF